MYISIVYRRKPHCRCTLCQLLSERWWMMMSLCMLIQMLSCSNLAWFSQLQANTRGIFPSNRDRNYECCARKSSHSRGMDLRIIMRIKMQGRGFMFRIQFLIFVNMLLPTSGKMDVGLTEVSVYCHGYVDIIMR